MADSSFLVTLKTDVDAFEAAILEAENALYRKENARLKVEVAELRALLSKRTGQDP